MHKHTGFKDIKREEPPIRPIEHRIRDYKEVEQLLPLSTLKQQAERCMDFSTHALLFVIRFV